MFDNDISLENNAGKFTIDVAYYVLSDLNLKIDSVNARSANARFAKTEKIPTAILNGYSTHEFYTHLSVCKYICNILETHWKTIFACENIS